MTLKLIAIGGLGNMLGPSAVHLKNSATAQYVRVLDRKQPGARRDKFRQAWQEHGAQLVNDFNTLIGKGDFDGVVICAGKNGDDYQIICDLIPLLQVQAAKQNYFILHLSTVSCDFVTATHAYCAAHHINYVNYPLTGGAKGAETASMLVLASGDQPLYARVEPMLKLIGVPKYFSPLVDFAAAVKLIGHIGVFHGLLSISLAVSLHKQLVDLPSVDKNQIPFFDFLNQGAGGVKQWEFPVRYGILENNWQHGFLIRHAVIDIFYTIQLLQAKNLSPTLCLPLFEVALLFIYLLQNHPEQELTTQAVTKLIATTPKTSLDTYLKAHLSLDSELCFKNCLAELPLSIRNSLMLMINYPTLEN